VRPTHALHSCGGFIMAQAASVTVRHRRAASPADWSR